MLTMVWVAIGAGGAIYAIVTFAHADSGEGFRLMLQWPSEPQFIIDRGVATEILWFVLTVPLLIAGFVRLRGWWPRNWLRVTAWAGSWTAGVMLLCLSASWAIAGIDGNHRWLSVGELAICFGWLSLGMAMTLILSLSPNENNGPRTRANPDAHVEGLRKPH